MQLISYLYINLLRIFVFVLQYQIEQLAKWVRKECRRCGMDKAGADSTIIVHNIPHITLYCPQYAFVTIFDPIMQKLEPFIPQKKK